MNHELEIHYHKNRLAGFHQEAKLDRLSNSVTHAQSQTESSTGIKQKLSNWMSRFRTQPVAKIETPITYKSTLQEDSSS